MTRFAPDDRRGATTFRRRLHEAEQDLRAAQARRRVAFAALDLPTASRVDADVRRLAARVHRLRSSTSSAEARSPR